MRPFSRMWWRSAIRVRASTFLSMRRIDEAGAFELLETAPDLGPHQRRQALGRLVQDEEPRVGHQRPGDREHLLLAARELVTHVVEPDRQRGKQAQHPVEGPGILPPPPVGRRRHEVLPDREVGKDLAPLGHEPEADLRHAVRRPPVDRPAVEANLPGERRDDAHDRAHGRRLAHAVAPQESHDFAFADVEIDAEEDLTRAVGRLEALHPQHHSILAAGSSPR